MLATLSAHSLNVLHLGVAVCWMMAYSTGIFIYSTSLEGLPPQPDLVIIHEQSSSCAKHETLTIFKRIILNSMKICTLRYTKSTYHWQCQMDNFDGSHNQIKLVRLRSTSTDIFWCYFWSCCGIIWTFIDMQAEKLTTWQTRFTDFLLKLRVYLDLLSWLLQENVYSTETLFKIRKSNFQIFALLYDEM